MVDLDAPDPVKKYMDPENNGIVNRRGLSRKVLLQYDHYDCSVLTVVAAYFRSREGCARATASRLH